MRTLQQILIDANATLDLDASLPTGTELTTRANYANQAVFDASATGQLSEFKMEYTASVSASSIATLPLPGNFRELQEDPQISDSSGGWSVYKGIEAENKYSYSTGDRYAYVLGNPASGYNLIVNNIIAGNLSVVYQRYPSGLATLSNVCELSDPQYIVRKIESYVLYSRSDDRFPIAEQKSEQVLSNMMGREMKGTTGRGRDTLSKFKNPLGR